MTAQECLLKAALCDQMARDTLDRINHALMREAAKHWRTLARTATAAPRRNENDR